MNDRENIGGLVQGYQKEVILKMKIMHEQVALSKVQPDSEGVTHEVVGRNPVPNNDVVSAGDENFDLNVTEGKNPDGSTGIRFWACQAEEIHDVYQEPTGGGNIHFEGVYNTIGSVAFDEPSDKDISANEWGLQVTSQGKLWIPVWEHYQRDLPVPITGDLFEFWGGSWQEFGIFFEATSVKENGRINNSPHFTNWEIDILRKDGFVPERRLLGANDLLCSEDNRSDPNLRDPD
jgi:hypothetical protein